MAFINNIKNNFKNIADTKTILVSAEMTTIITSIRCTNITDSNIRVTLEDIRLLKNPIEEAYLCYKLLVLPNQTIDLLMVTKGNDSELVEHTLLDGDNLVCYSSSYSENFSVIVTGYELLESET
jgi:hypothetical protein